ncbi:MAG: phage tail sheath subtilisin-like domain-containing protein [Alphaproteobacteria bacterium]|nr:phage tail sheath subtilisin-like domain-containing protein [Alphaproteobacteria bacterium]
MNFDTIPLTLRTPGQYAEFDNSMAIQGLTIDATNVLVFGQKLNSGTATANQAVQVLSADHAAQLFGRGSLLHAMFATYKANDETTKAFAMPLADDAAGVAATGTFTITGTATEAGTIAAYLGGKRVRAGISVGDTANVAGAALAAAINADLDLVVTAANANGLVTLTARHKGAFMNGFDLRLNRALDEAVPAGLAIAVANMSGGTANPELAAALAAMGDTHYHHVVLPYTDSSSLAAVKAEADTRADGTHQVDMQVWAAAAGSHGTLTTLGNSMNSQWISIMGADASPTPAYLWAAAYGARAAYYLSNDAARPLQTLVLAGVIAPDETSRFTRAERNLLLYDGIATFMVGTDGSVMIERAVTTFQTNTYNLPDASYLDSETLATLSILRRTLRARIASRYPRHKLAADGTRFAMGQAVVTPSIMRGELIDLARRWEELGWVEQVDDYKDKLIVEIDPNDPNRINALIPPNLVNQLRVFAGKIQFRL